MTDKVIPLGTYVEIIIYEDATDRGVVIRNDVDDLTGDIHYLIRADDGVESTPWDDTCIRVLTKLDKVLK